MADPALFHPEHDAVVSTTLDGHPVSFKVSEHKVGGLDLGGLKDKKNDDGSSKYSMDSLVSTNSVTREPIDCQCNQPATPVQNPVEGGTA